MQSGDPGVPEVIDIIFGRWRSQILLVGTRLGVFDAMSSTDSVNAHRLAIRVGADPAMFYRLCRALASIGMLSEHGGQCF